MKLDFEEYVINIAEHVSESLGGILDVSTIRWISPPSGKELVKDASLAFFVDGKKRTDDIVLLIANAQYGWTVAKDTERAREVASKVSQEIGRHIATPVFQGQLGQQSYSAFSRLSPLSDHRLIRNFQRAPVTKRVVPWLIELAKQTRKTRENPAEYERYFISPLRVLSKDEDLSRHVRDFAISALEYVQSEKPNMFTVVAHGDLWYGNVLLERRIAADFNPYVGDFCVIDWRGARLDGYPCIDLARLSMSIYKIGSRRIDALVDQYAGNLGVSRLDMGVYGALALGRLGVELDQFPKDRYYSICDEVLEFLEVHVLDR